MKHFSSMRVRTVVALLCIMLVSLAVVIVFGTYAVTQNQYDANVAQEEANIDSLAQVLDQGFVDYLSLATQISTQRELRPYRLLKTDAVSQIEARALLRALKGANRSIIDICLYDLEQDFFVTSVASYQPRSFIQSYYSFSRIERGAVYELFCTPASKSNPRLLPVGTVYTSSNDTSLSDALLFLTPLPQRSIHPYATLGILIQINDIREQLSIVAGENAARIVDAHGTTLVSVGENRLSNGFLPDKKVRVFRRESERLDLVYESFISEETLSRTNLASSRLILTLFFLALLVALACVLFARWVNHPIQTLITNIGGTNRFVDESSYIRQYIYDLGKIVDQNEKYVNELLVRRLLAGQPLHEDELARCESILKKDYAHCAIMSVRLAHRPESVLPLTTRVYEHALVNMLQDAQLETLVCIIACDELNDEVLKLAATLLSEPPMKGASAAIGTIEDDLLQLRDSQIRAVNHMKEMLYQGRCGIEIAPISGDRKNAYPSDIMHHLHSAFRSNQPAEMRLYSERLCEILLDPLTSPETGAIVAYDLALLFPELTSKISCSAQIFCESLRQCVADIANRLESTPPSIVTAEPAAEPTRQEFADAIDEMLDQPGFGISTISERFNMSDSAFSHMFKRSFGTTFINYVNQMKIQRAKTLLAESNLSLDALAEQLGYSSASNFVRMFKKYEGITPGAYRQAARSTGSNES